MDSTVIALSTLNTLSLSSNLDGIDFKQFKKRFTGDFQFNFAFCLSGANDFQSKNYTDFYLTNNRKASEFYNIENSTFVSEKFVTYIKQGESYLNFTAIDPTPYQYADRINEIYNYGAVIFGEFDSNTSLFELTFKDNGNVTISHLHNNELFYLVSDNTNNLFFIKESFLTFNDDINEPQYFKYIYQQNNIFLILFQDKVDDFYYIYKLGNDLVMDIVTEENKQQILDNKFELSRKKYLDSNVSLDTSFITYNNNDNNINELKSIFDLNNNFLLHRKNCSVTSSTDIIVLKNQMVNNKDDFSSSNNMLSSQNPIYVDDFRDYTSIFEDIPSETTENLELNYVCYNHSYVIPSGTTKFVSPSSMFPYTKLNINDSKIIQSGAFAFTSPNFSDKVYYYDKSKNLNNGQHYLCTWLSGSPLSENNVWIDRYYYPDLVSKEIALSSKPIFQSTYDDYIEQLINANVSTLKTPISDIKFFDKLSDLTFVPNKTYTYDRIQADQFSFVQSTISYCNSFVSNYPTNYFKTINASGEFTIGIYFNGNQNVWTLQSDRNDIDAGVSIVKTATNVTITYTLFDPSINQYSEYTTTTNFKALKENFVCIGFNSITGEGYVMLNNEILSTIDEPPAQFARKMILFGDFFVYENGNKINLLNYTGTNIVTPFLSNQFYEQNLAYIISIVNGKTTINDITISLPCGMRNNSDNINILHSICGNAASKSNLINIRVKNMNIQNSEVLESLKDQIINNIQNELPVSTQINNVTFENYK